MDALDLKILKELADNSRIPISILSKKLKVSREVLTYRINKLRADKIILGFTTEIDYKSLGYIAAALFLKIKVNKEKEFEKFSNSCGFVSWVAELSGIWSYGLSIYGKTNEELNNNLLKVFNEFKEEILEYRFILHDKTEFFYNKYFGASNNNRMRSLSLYKADKIDKIILESISNNSRMDCVALSEKVGITAPAVSQRIKNLQKAGIIHRYSLFIDLSKLNLMQYSIFLDNKNISSKGKLTEFLKSHKRISFVAEYSGTSLIEFGVVVSNPYLLREVLREVGDYSEDNRIIEISMFQKEFISVGLPKIVFN